ncbi:MAG: FAD-binding protein [Streptosporangiales bacterium]|nr:FAD-binding protein [Streptosporangiales bacterium]
MTAAYLPELARVVGPGTVITDPEQLDVHAHDLWPVSAKEYLQGRHPHRPDAVVRVTDESQIPPMLVWAAERKVPVTPRGLGSGVTGAAVPVHGGIVLDLSALAGIVDLDETDLTVTVRAGTRGDTLEDALAERGYTLGHSPQSLPLSSPGGWVATRAIGQFSSRYGGIEDLVVSLTVVLPTGETVRLPRVPRAAVGPDLKHLFLGAEGTLGIVTEVTLRIFPLPEHRTVQALRFPDVASGIEAMRHITRAGLRPFLVRLYDEDESRIAMNDGSFDGCALFLGSEGVRAVAEAEQVTALDCCTRFGGERLGPEPAQRWLDHRYDVSALESLLRHPGGLVETIEVAHFWSRIHRVYADLKDALTPLAGVLGHFSHVYSHGTSLYLILVGEAADDAAVQRRLTEIWTAAMEICLEHDAAISHHHGVGIARLPYLRRALGEGATTVLHRVKAALDPAGVLNPGKLGTDRPHSEVQH